MSLVKNFLLGLLLSLWASLASAGVNCTVPFTFVPNTLADANQVNANYAALVACLLNAAGAGNNNDITALLALTTPITPVAGGSTMYVGAGSTGSANAQVIASPSPTGFTLTRGLSILFTASFTNTGATTLAVNGTAATPLFRQSPSGPQALTGGELVLNDLVWAVYDGTQFQLINSGSQYGGFGPLTSLDTGGATADLGTVPSHNITFTAASVGRGITSFGSSASVTFPEYRLNFATALTLTHNGTSLILPSATNITTAVGDNAVALYLGAGNWQVISYNRANGTSVVSPTPLCGFSGLSIVTASDTQINWSFNSSNLLTTANVPLYSGVKSGSITVTNGTGGTSTAGGMDGTAPGNNAFIYMYAISNGSVWNAVASNTVPSSFTNLPAGYTYSCYMGAMKALNSTHVYGSVIRGNEARYVVGGGSLATTLPIIDTGTPKGSNCAAGATTYVTETVRGDSGAGIWMPSTAGLGVFVLSTNAGVSALAPNATPTAGNGGVNAINPGGTSQTVSLLLESNNVFYCNVGSASAWLSQYGWRDAVNAN